MQNSLELHQPNMHIGYRVIPLSGTPHKFPKYFYMHYLVYFLICMCWIVLLLYAKPTIPLLLLCLESPLIT